MCLTKVVTAKERSAQNGVRDEQGHFNEWMDLSFFVYYRYLSSLNCGAGFGFLLLGFCSFFAGFTVRKR